MVVAHHNDGAVDFCQPAQYAHLDSGGIWNSSTIIWRTLSPPLPVSPAGTMAGAWVAAIALVHRFVQEGMGNKESYSEMTTTGRSG